MIRKRIILLSKNVKVSITIDEIRLKSNLNFNQFLIFTKKSFSHTTLSFIQSQSGVLCDVQGYIQLIPAIYESDTPINITGNDEILLKYFCLNGSIVNGNREPILYSFGPIRPQVIKYTENPESDFLKR